MGGVASTVQTAQTGGQSSGKGGYSAPPSMPQPQSNFGTDSGGKGGYSAPQSIQQPPQPMGKGGTQTNSATSGQPRMGQQNQYSNTVGQWDNNQQQQPQFGGGKGKG